MDGSRVQEEVESYKTYTYTPRPQAASRKRGGRDATSPGFLFEDKLAIDQRTK